MVMPMPPWSWIDCWPMNFPDLPTCTLAAATAVAAAKVQIGRSARYVGQQSIQLHGGIGMTMEAKIGHYFKRLTMIESSFGDADYHLRRVSDAGGLV